MEWTQVVLWIGWEQIEQMRVLGEEEGREGYSGFG